MNVVDPIYDKEKIHEMKKVLKSGMNGERNLLLFELGLSLAFRVQDLLDLRKKDVSSGVIKKKTNKRGKEIELRLNDRVFTMVKGYVAYLEEDDKLFSIDRTQSYRILNAAAKRVGIECFGTHSMRKTKAYHLYNDSNHNLALVMELLQHSDPEYTLRYIGWKKKRLSDSVHSHDL
ncbi:MAG: tyrosine-type recombinase/integrase [Bacillota bacterium]